MAFTFFFRDIHTIEHIVRHVVPFAAGRSVVKVWDAGCAMGPEPYTLAIVFAENMGKFAYKNLKIDATDIDGSNLFGDIIRAGVYPYEELQRIPKELFEKYFLPDGDGQFRIIEPVRTRLAFQKHDLLALKPIGDGFCLIMCKNVLLHFSHEQRIEVIKMFHAALAPGGFFASEQTQKMPKELAHLFEQVTPDAQLYRKR
ncbi:chemotaxis protein methyltransferase [Geobacter sp. OR-1]|uniref:CheR family methyltransferase n=1 Tax=Geobacter sp. OR-1 TaxID=1266765 RepID=UPI000542D89A|nr:CheR family methyltransferase [Geobacter sp. OR-1]GAM11619.1 chemotaxis protein methyltransferase [Geobacter sp. OR-1]